MRQRKTDLDRALWGSASRKGGPPLNLPLIFVGVLLLVLLVGYVVANAVDGWMQ